MVVTRVRRGEAARLLLGALLTVGVGSAPGCRGGCSPPADQQPVSGSGQAATAASQGQPVTAPAVTPPLILEEFARPGPLLPERWVETRHNDFAEAAVEVVADPLDSGDGRLRLSAATIGTDDRTVKRLGVVHPRPFDLTQPLTITVDLDWNRQVNGSYLSWQRLLSPTFTTANPEESPDWLAFNLVGVPPGQTARPELLRKNYGNLQEVDRFGWPGIRPGREMGRERVTLALTGRALRLALNGKELTAKEDAGFRFDKAYLYLQMTTHSNYPRRELFVDRVEVRGSLATP